MLWRITSFHLEFYELSGYLTYFTRNIHISKTSMFMVTWHHVFVYFFFSFPSFLLLFPFGPSYWTQGFVHINQALYHLPCAPRNLKPNFNIPHILKNWYVVTSLCWPSLCYLPLFLGKFQQHRMFTCFFDVCASDIWNNMFQILQNNFKVYPQKIYRPSPTILWTSARCPKTSLRCHVRVMPLRLSSGKLNLQLPKERCFIVDQMGSKQFSSLYKKFCLHASNLWPFLFL